MSGNTKNEGKQFPPVPESDDEPQVQYQNISLTLLHKLKKADVRKMLDYNQVEWHSSEHVDEFREKARPFCIKPKKPPMEGISGKSKPELINYALDLGIKVEMSMTVPQIKAVMRVSLGNPTKSECSADTLIEFGKYSTNLMTYRQVQILDPEYCEWAMATYRTGASKEPKLGAFGKWLLEDRRRDADPNMAQPVPHYEEPSLPSQQVPKMPNFFKGKKEEPSPAMKQPLIPEPEAASSSSTIRMDRIETMLMSLIRNQQPMPPPETESWEMPAGNPEKRKNVAER